MKSLEPYSIRLLALLLSLVAVTLAQTGQSASNSAPESAQSMTQSGTQVNPDRPAPQHRNPRYQVMRSDVLSVSFALSPELDQVDVKVQPDGYINLPLIGSMYVQGMTVPEIVEALKKAYGKVLHDPIIEVDLSDFQKPYFVALGQVGKPGQYDLRYDMTVTEAIGVAGGFAPTAKTQVFLYRRDGAMWVEAKELKLKDFLHGKNISEDVHLMPGDMIFVPEKTITKIRKYVPYTVGLGVYPSVPTL
jgi:polysaccharide export outer membrane protein